MTLPDWQLPVGVDRGLWDYLHSGEMVRGYDAQMNTSPLAAADVRFCETVFAKPGRLLDLGCGTGRLCVHFAGKGFDCVGVDLSPEMLAQAKANATNAEVSVELLESNLVDLSGVPDVSFDYAACLFSTLGMIRGAENREAALRAAFRVLKLGGKLVLHVHNCWFHRLGWSRILGQFGRTQLGTATAGDVTMPQSYGGAALTLHHFTQREVCKLLAKTGFRVHRVEPITETGDTRVSLPWRVYGYLIAAEK